TSEDIARLGETHGRERAAAAIAAAAAVQMQSIKIATVTLPSGTKLMRPGDDSALSADDIDWLNTRTIAQAQARALFYATSVRETLWRWARELCHDSYPRAQELMRQLGDARI